VRPQSCLQLLLLRIVWQNVVPVDDVLLRLPNFSGGEDNDGHSSAHVLLSLFFGLLQQHVAGGVPRFKLDSANADGLVWLQSRWYLGHILRSVRGSAAQ